MKHWAAVFCLSALFLFSGCGQSSSSDTNAPAAETPLTIGAVIPLSGPGVVYGEDMKNAIELALEELATAGVDMRVVYADSQALAKEGVAAYTQLNATEDVDVVVTAFSRVSVPLVDLAHERKQPIVATLVAAKGLAAKSPYAFRFFSPPHDYAEPHFETRLTKKNYASIGVLYINDEYGASIFESITQLSAKEGISIVATESFEPNATDVRTELTKIKTANPDAFVLVASTPPETMTVVKQLRELEFPMDIFEAGVVLSIDSNRAALGDMAEGIYTNAYPFTLSENDASLAFRNAYAARFNDDPNFIAPFAYDIVRIIAQASGGKKMQAEELAQAIQALGTFDSVNGPVLIQHDGEITPPIRAVRVENGGLVRVE